MFTSSVTLRRPSQDRKQLSYPRPVLIIAEQEINAYLSRMPRQYLSARADALLRIRRLGLIPLPNGLLVYHRGEVCRHGLLCR